MSTETAAVLSRACEQVGLDDGAAELIRAGENDLYRLPGSVVARISRPGQVSAAAKELRVTRWLADTQVPAVRPWEGQDAPVVVGERAVTFWYELPPHEQGSTTDVAGLLCELHSLDLPDGMDLPGLAPFVRVAERIDGATWLDPQDRDWLRKHLAELQDAYQELPAGIPWRLVHGDAWRGNVATTAGGPILMDFERCAYGPPEWDLVSTAVAHVTTGWLTTEQWTAYCRTYGYDVTTWGGFEVFRGIRELRMTTAAAQLGEASPSGRAQAAHRIACLRGCSGPRPWGGWHMVP
ncbi:phosphotransferase enzyme family protein [Saccharopolyspora sp. NPDC002578]